MHPGDERRITIATMCSGMLVLTGIAYVSVTSWSRLRPDRYTLLFVAAGVGAAIVDGRIRRAQTRRRSPTKTVALPRTNANALSLRGSGLVVTAAVAPVAIGCSAGLVANTLNAGTVVQGLMLLGVLALMLALTVAAFSRHQSNQRDTAHDHG